ncbi:hypothetical protein M3672_01440 [Microbacterium enclense]|uniref:hypothetical protein n=1 Tax=Microbacterium enclense TaxID=993073 RepID=UPI0012B7861C|nr:MULTISPECIES: hypothetical protein [Microbacterium]MCM3613099.1 hypothetical protein [Microbacterium enclense]
MASRPPISRRELVALILVFIACGVAVLLSAPTALLPPVAGLAVAIVAVATARWWRRRGRSG